MTRVAAPPFPLARFTVEQYHRMIASGAFTEHDRIELIEGWVIEQIAKGPGHEFAVGRGEDCLRDLVGVGWHVRNQAPITLERSEPEPDLVVVRGERGDYRARHPAASDVVLVVEVSDTTLDTDRLKGKTYGASGVPEYWIVNLVERCVEAFGRPDPASASGYLGRQRFGEGDEVPLSIEGQRVGGVPVAELLP